MSYVNAPIHDLLIRVKNSYMARRLVVEGVVFSKFKEEILMLLKRFGFIKGYEVTQDGKKKFININLKEVKNPIIDIPVVKFISTPSRRLYASYDELKPIAGGRGIGIISTNQGIMATHEAKAKKLGGELIAEIY